MNASSLIIASLLVSLIPLLLAATTSYLKVSIVLGMLRSGLGTQHVPNGLVVFILSIAISCIVMRPIAERISSQLTAKDIKECFANPTVEKFQNIQSAFEPLKEFLLRNSGAREINAFAQMENLKVEPSQIAHAPWHLVIPAFVLSELKAAFLMGFLLLLPFLAIDIVIANILVGLGMSMVTPIIITLPLKLALLVSADGWLLIMQSLIRSYGVSA